MLAGLQGPFAPTCSVTTVPLHRQRSRGLRTQPHGASNLEQVVSRISAGTRRIPNSVKHYHKIMRC